MSDDISTYEKLANAIQRDIIGLVVYYSEEMKKQGYPKEKEYGLMIVSALQSTVEKMYMKIMGPKETAMLFYNMADRMVDFSVSDKEDYYNRMNKEIMDPKNSDMIVKLFGEEEARRIFKIPPKE
jgi:hypothetical protein